MVLNTHGAISRALAQLVADGGPDLDLSALAEQAEVPLEWLYQLDQGRLDKANLVDLERVCRILGRSPNDVLGYETDE